MNHQLRIASPRFINQLNSIHCYISTVKKISYRMVSSFLFQIDVTKCMSCKKTNIFHLVCNKIEGSGPFK